MSRWPQKPHLVEGEEDKFRAFKLARAALAASGTVTLELGVAGTPMAVAYRVDPRRGAPAVPASRSIPSFWPISCLAKTLFPNSSRKIARLRSSAPRLRLCSKDTPERAAATCGAGQDPREDVPAGRNAQRQSGRRRAFHPRNRAARRAARPNKRSGRMRILHVMLSKVNGGAETYACDVIAKLHEAGIDQCVVMYEDAPRFAELKALGIRMAPVAFARSLLARSALHAARAHRARKAGDRADLDAPRRKRSWERERSP